MRVSTEIILSVHSVSRQSGEQTTSLDGSLFRGNRENPVTRPEQNTVAPRLGLECHITSRSNSRMFKGKDFSRSLLVLKARLS